MLPRVYALNRSDNKYCEPRGRWVIKICFAVNRYDQKVSKRPEIRIADLNVAVPVEAAEGGGEIKLIANRMIII